MARIRYLKPEFFSDEDLCALSYQARLLFAGLWCYADREGRLEDRPKYIKAMIFPYDNLDIEKLLHSLTQPKPFIHRYESGGKRIIQIITWKKHQKPHHTEKKSSLPAPNGNFPPIPPLMEKGMEKGMGSIHEASTELRNGEITVKEPLKLQYGEFNNVSLKETEFLALCEKFGEKDAKDTIEVLSAKIKAQPKKYSYKDHYATLITWTKNQKSWRKPTEW